MARTLISRTLISRTLFGFLLSLGVAFSTSTLSDTVHRNGVSASSAQQASVAMLRPTARADQNAAIDALVNQFDDVVFGQEHGKIDQIIRRWQVAPTVAVFAAPSYKGKLPFAIIRGHLDSISQLTGLAINQTADLKTATLRLGYYPREDFAKLPASPDADPEHYARFIQNSACLGLAAGATDQPGDLDRGAILIGADIDEAVQNHCLLEELVQIMGLPNDACHYRPSLFCEADYVYALTHEDRILLKTLYDSRLSNGMQRAEALPIARSIIADLILDH